MSRNPGFPRRPRVWVALATTLLLLRLPSLWAGPPTAGAPAPEAPFLIAKARDGRFRLVRDAELLLGSPYRYGGLDSKGFDCSGLVWRVYKEALGLEVPRTTRSLHELAQPLDLAELEPGDLVFFNTTARLSHVGLFVGSGEFIHAASEGSRRGVIRSSLDEPYWQKRLAGAGRLIAPQRSWGLFHFFAVYEGAGGRG
jgi:probable lipoprotein NlpC